MQCEVLVQRFLNQQIHFTIYILILQHSVVIPSPGSCYRAGRQWQGRGVISEAVGAAADCERLGL